MKKILLLIPFLCLTSCGSTTKSEEVIPSESASETKKVDDTLLTSYDGYDDLIAHENRYALESSIKGSNEVPDPFIYRYNGMYYLYATTNGGFIKAYKSEDLLNFEPVDNGILSEGLVYNYTTDENHPADNTPYAPEVIYYNGMFYLIASPSGNGHYILQSDSPEGPFECISENIGCSIDGSFFIDSDESIYLYTAGSGGLNLYEMEDDFTNVVYDGKDAKNYFIGNCVVGGWNEGPYMLQRNGQYYFTYCGTHYLSDNYRVDYAYLDAGSSIKKNSSYKREGNLILATEDGYVGLGHSCTILGPDLDSYFVVYHNLETSHQRYLNYSRLSFNGEQMVANSVREGEIKDLYEPEFYARNIDEIPESGNYYLSNVATSDAFTVEYNVTGEGKMIFGYQDDNNYEYLNYANNQVEIHKVTNTNDELLKTISFNKEYDAYVNHTFRLQYNNGLTNFYFDNIEKLALDDSLTLNGGKIGYLKNNNFDEIGYTACSNVAIGSSDYKAYDEDISLANSYDPNLSILSASSGLVNNENENKSVLNKASYMLLNEVGDRATYKMQASEDDYYDISLRIACDSVGKKVGLKIDNDEIIEINLSDVISKVKKGDTNVLLKDVYLEEGPHHISLVNIGDPIEFLNINYVPFAENLETSYIFDDDYEDNDDLITRGNFEVTNKGLATNNQACVGFATVDKFKNATIVANVVIKSKMEMGSSLGLLFNANNYTEDFYNDDGDGSTENTYQGYRFSLVDGRVTLDYVDYYYTSTLMTSKLSYALNEEIEMKVEINNNKIICYIDDEVVIEYGANVGNLSGRVGMLGANVDASILAFETY